MSWWQYLLLVNLYLLLFYGFYAVLLRSETFFQLNRLYLVTSSLLSFFIPVFHNQWIRDLFITKEVQHTLFSYQAPDVVYNFKPIQDHHITVGQILLYLYVAGTLVLALKFVWQLLSLKRIISDPGASGAFSFFKAIRLGGNSSADNQQIITEHEQVHARQWHSADILLIETIAVINWFNPIVYYYRFGIKHIHEYIADQQAVKNGTDKAEYALLLLSQAFKAPTHRLVTPFFNESLLKRRIIMLQKSRSRYAALLKYGLLAPLFILMLVLSAAAISRNKTVRLINRKAEEVFLTPATSLAPVKENTRPAPRHTIKNPPPVIVLSDAIAKKDDNGPVFTIVEQEPEFKGGIQEFYNFLNQNLRYPEQMIRANVQGKIIVSMTVEQDGSLSDIKVVKDIGFGSGEEAVRVLQLSPKWIPGFQNGHAVRVRFTLPIAFNLVTLKSADDTVQHPLPETKVTIAANAKADTPINSHVVLWNNSDCPPNAVYVMDGTIITDIGVINPADIQSIRVYSHITPGDSMVKLYGQKALNGVVIIKTKNNNPVKAPPVQPHN